MYERGVQNQILQMLLSLCKNCLQGSILIGEKTSETAPPPILAYDILVNGAGSQCPLLTFAMTAEWLREVCWQCLTTHLSFTFLCSIETFV